MSYTGAFAVLSPLNAIVKLLLSPPANTKVVRVIAYGDAADCDWFIVVIVDYDFQDVLSGLSAAKRQCGIFARLCRQR